MLKNFVKWGFILSIGYTAWGSALPDGVYVIDSSLSQVQWEGRKKLVASRHQGQVPVQGRVTFRNGLPVEGEITFQISQLTVTDIAPDNPDNARLSNHLKSADFFDVEKYPTARFVWKKAQWVQKEREVQVDGELTIKDQTRPHRVKATLSRESDQSVLARGETIFNRTNFGVIYGSDSFFKKLAVNRIIADDVKLEFRLQARLEDPVQKDGP